MHAKYEDAALEISASLPLSRNILLALLSLQSWKPFMQRWLRSSIVVLESKEHSTVLDKTLKAASGILKVHCTPLFFNNFCCISVFCCLAFFHYLVACLQILVRLAEAAIPRSAENIVLAFGAFCLVKILSPPTILLE